VCTPPSVLQAEADYGIRAVYFDIDNTLVPNNNSGVPSERFCAAAQRAGEYVTLAVATARPLEKASRIMEAIGASGISILSDGAQLYDVRTDSMVRETVMSKDETQTLLDMLRVEDIAHTVQDNGRDYAWIEGSKLYATPRNIWFPMLGYEPAETYRPLKPFVIAANAVSKDRLPDVREIVADHGAATTVARVVHENADGTFEVFITNWLTNKKTALNDALRMQNLDPAQVMAVGDGPNDAVLLEVAGISVALENAVPKTLEAADFIAPAYNYNGAAVALERLILAGR
jgi:HAD superfamily hydrolase (TIGR01484 family)